MKREKYLDAPVVVREENDVSGKKRVWVQVTETRAEMVKLEGGAKKADIDAAAAKRLADLKEIQAKEIELKELEAAAAALRAQLGIE